MGQALQLPEGVEVVGPEIAGTEPILTPEALAFLGELHRRFEPRRRELLAARAKRQSAWDSGALPGFLAETKDIRGDASWRVSAIPAGLQDRRVEITGPVTRKMMINALNSGARVFMADFEDSLSPTWQNVMDGQRNLYDYARGELSFHDAAKDKQYAVGDDPATLVVRVRGWHLDEVHIRVDGAPMSAGLVDFGLHFWHNGHRLPDLGLGPWFYLPKMEHHLEARLWNDVFLFAQEAVSMAPGTIKVTCLIETFPAVFQMEEILYELRQHMAGLNAGRWDYIFSCIKVSRQHGNRILPDRGLVTMTVPFMRAYTELLVRTCHKRGAFAMGGMSAFIPNRADPAVTENALAQVRADKVREAADGCDGTWVAHPDLVGVAMEIFDKALGESQNQTDVLRSDVSVSQEQLQDFHIPDAAVTMDGVRANIDVGLRYIESWLRGVGAAAIHNLMEDAATAEISRSQIWQWMRHGVTTTDGTRIDRPLLRGLVDNIGAELAADAPDGHRFAAAARIFQDVALDDDFPAFLTIPAYGLLTKDTAP